MIWGKRDMVASKPISRRIQIQSSIQDNSFSIALLITEKSMHKFMQKWGALFSTFHQITSISSNWKKSQFHESNSRWILPWLFLINGKVKIIKRITCNSGSIMKIHAKNKWIFNDPIHHGLQNWKTAIINFLHVEEHFQSLTSIDAANREANAPFPIGKDDDSKRRK